MVKSVIPPYEGPPISRPIYREMIFQQGRYVRTGDTIGYEKTFIDDVWRDDRNWNNQNVWGE